MNSFNLLLKVVKPILKISRQERRLNFKQFEEFVNSSGL